MKFIHLSDLHIGKRFCELSMIDDQKFILKEILSVARDEQPDAVIIAGDVYDKSVPSAEAVALFDDFLCSLAELKTEVFVISGNHDSAERIAFGGRLMDNSGVHISPVYSGAQPPVKIKDGSGEVNVYMLPFVRPGDVRSVFPEAEINSYNDAVKKAVDEMDIDPAERNILITHQFVTGSVRSESEDVAVGGTDNVDAAVFESFDYVALGHLHSPQKCERETIRYCGAPLKYSFQEANDEKSVTVVELNGKGDINIRAIPLTPEHDVKCIRGKYDDITLRSYYENTGLQNAYLKITLTDEQDIIDAVGKLRVIYPGLLKLEYDNTRTREHRLITADNSVENKSEFELFGEFFENRNNSPMSGFQREYIKSLIEKLKEGTL